MNQGSAYVFVRVGSTWIQQAQLTATGGAANDQFGISVALDGDTALVGAYGDDVGGNTAQGSAYVFVRSGSTWTQQAKLTAADGAANDFFGVCVALDGDTALVGVPEGDVGAAFDQGSAYIFTRSGTTWTQQAKLSASDGATNDSFGESVALAGDTALVGASRHDVGATDTQGAAYVYFRTGSSWSQQAKLTAADGAASDRFGFSVALSGDTALVGAYFDDVGVNSNQGSAYVFIRSGSTWTQQAKLTAADGAASDVFGGSVALFGDTALVGPLFDDAIAPSDQGSAYIFTRSGTTWNQQARLTAADDGASDRFGISVALSEDTALVGASRDDVDANNNQGSTWTFNLASDDLSVAHNDVTDVSYPSIAEALLPAVSGQQITATEAAWRNIGTLNTFGRSLGLLSSGDIRTPPISVIDLGGSSALSAAPGSVMEIFGLLRVASGASGDVFADTFRLGSRGIMTARTNSSLTINAALADLDGQTRLEQGASLTFAGGVTAIGPTTCNLNSALTAGGVFTNIDTFTVTSGTISTPLLDNRALANIFGASALFGGYANQAGATTTIRSGTFFVFGSLTNNGTIVGTICSGCLVDTPPSMDVGGALQTGPGANLVMPFEGSTVRVGGDFDCAIDSNTRYDMSVATLRLEGAGVEQRLEVMSADIGANPQGLDRGVSGHYPIGTLHIGPTPTTVRLVDTHDNDGQGQGVCEAIYVDTLRIEAGSRLVNFGCRIYYNTLINNGTIDEPGNVIGLSPPCIADFNGDDGVDDLDITAFFAAFEQGEPSADVNGDDGIDDLDITAFFTAFEAGC